MAPLTRLAITLPPLHAPEDFDLLQAILALHVSHGWQEESPPTGEARCVIYCPVPEMAASLAAHVARELPSAVVEQSEEEEQNWAEAWKEFFTPVEGGAHFLVLAPWMEQERKALEGTARMPLLIEPKTAFGTGHHDTTALCLDAISGLYDEGVIRPGMRFLDLGTGSGILGIACAMLGLAGDGLDIDPAAVDNALENRAINGAPPERFRVAHGGVEEAEGPYDLVVANILAEPLRQLAPHLAALRTPDGGRPALVLSGLLGIQADGVERAYAEQGYAAPRRVLRGEWAALLFV